MLFETGDKILFIGDSVTDCERMRPIGESSHGGWGNSYVATIGAYLTAMHPEKRLRVVNMGIGGNQVRDLKTRWQSDVLDLEPSWVSVLIGINDVWRQFDSPLMPEKHVPLDEYEVTYDRLIEQTLAIAKGMILMTPFFLEPNAKDPMRARMDEYSAVVKKLAGKYNQTFIDLQSAWDELFAHLPTAAIAWDRVHPNQTGHMYIAQQFIKAIDA